MEIFSVYDGFVSRLRCSSFAAKLESKHRYLYLHPSYQHPHTCTRVVCVWVKIKKVVKNRQLCRSHKLSDVTTVTIYPLSEKVLVVRQRETPPAPSALWSAK